MKDNDYIHALDKWFNGRGAVVYANQSHENLVNKFLSETDRSRIIEMAWEDRTPFEAIEEDYGLSEAAVIQLMRAELKPSSFRLWRARVSGRKTSTGRFVALMSTRLLQNSVHPGQGWP